MDIIAVIALFPDLSQVELVTWVERGWVHPGHRRSWPRFHEIDVARVRLIHDLRRGMDVGEDAIAAGAVAARPGLRAAQQDEIRAARGGSAAAGRPDGGPECHRPRSGRA